MIKKLSLPCKLLMTLVAVAIFGNLLNTQTIQFFYTISFILKECLSLLLPCIVFSFITTGILSFKKNAPLVLAILLLCVFISNILTAFFSYFIGKALLPLLAVKIQTDTLTPVNKMLPLFALNLPNLVTTDKAMLAAIFTGISLAFYPIPQINKSINNLKNYIIMFINNVFIPILPLYIFGFLLEINHQGIFLQLIKSYGKTFGLIVTLEIFIIFSIYYLAAKFNVKKTINYIKTAIPSFMTAFGSMSSAATIPVSAQCAEINTGNKSLSAMAIPILANIHLIGAAITTPILSLVTLFIFQNSIPNLTVYATFVLYFCINMLAVSGVPGGGIIIMIPILKSILGFDDTMVSIMTTLYFLQEGFVTASNVMGDGALIIIINKILKRLKID